MSHIKEKGFIHLPVLVAIFAVLFASAIIPVKRTYNDGKSSVAGVYLAKGGDDGDSSGRDSGSSDSSGSSGSSGESGSSTSSGPSTSGGSTTSKTTVSPRIIGSPKSVEIKTKEVSSSERIETRTTPEKIKSEIRQGNLRVKFEIENGRVKIETKVKKAEEETELEDEAEDEAVEEVENELEKEDVKIATADGQIALVNKRVGALSNFPLSVNPTTRQLTVTTPSGSKVVAVLPQQAIDNMLASKVMDDVVGERVNNSLASIPDLVKIETKNGVLVYKVKGTKMHRLLGLIPVKTAVEAFVSAENGQVVETNQSLLGRILNRLAP